MIGLRGLPAPVWRAQAIFGADDPSACAATLGGAYNDPYERVGAVPIVIIGILVAAYLKAKLSSR